MIDKFFSLGDKVTKGDPQRKAKFDYYLLWIMFCAFVMILIGNIIKFWQGNGVQYLGWAVFSCAILYFQYFALKQSHNFVKMLANQKTIPEVKVEDVKVGEETVDEMLKSFEGEEVKGGEQK